MVGTLRSVECNGKGCSGGVKAELFDGTDTVMLVWLGQRRIPGIESGRTLRVHGRVGKLEVLPGGFVVDQEQAAFRGDLAVHPVALRQPGPRGERGAAAAGRGTLN